MTGAEMIGRVTASGAEVINRDTGREWVERELSKPEYSASDLTPLERLGRWLDDLWESLLHGALQANSPWWLLVVLVAVAGIAALIVWRVRRAGLRRAHIPLAAFDSAAGSPDPQVWRIRAGEAADAGDFAAAVIDESRAIYAVLAERRVITLDSASTASELSRRAGAGLPDHREALDRVARVFNDIAFGARANGERGEDLSAVYAELCTLDSALSALPVHPAPSADRVVRA